MHSLKITTYGNLEKKSSAPKFPSSADRESQEQTEIESFYWISRRLPWHKRELHILGRKSVHPYPMTCIILYTGSQD